MDSSPSDATNAQVASPSHPSPSPSKGWTVKPVWSSGSDSNASHAFAKSFQDILNRTETYPILSDVLFRPVVAVLVVAYSFVLWRKARGTLGASVSWRDAIAVCALAACVYWRRMVLAIGLTGAYVAWSLLADGMWDRMSTTAGGKLPSFDFFLIGCHVVRHARSSKNSSEPATAAVGSPAPPDSEAAALARLETALGLPEKKPEVECVVCWSTSDEGEAPLPLPCSHLVCEPCLHRLKAASRNLCPFCRQPLYSLNNTKIYLFAALAAAGGAQLAIILVFAALKIAGRRYWSAAMTLVFYLTQAVLTLYSQWQVVKQDGAGMEGYFASTSVKSLIFKLVISLENTRNNVSGFDKVDWATFVDGKWHRVDDPDEWRDLRELVCWAVPGVAEKVLRC